MIQLPDCATKIEGHGWLHSYGLLARQAKELPEMVDATIAQNMRVCRKCGISKPLGGYQLMPRSGWKKANICKTCTAARQREWEQRRRETFDARNIDMAALRQCSRCKILKRAAEFSLAPAKRSGVHCWCVACQRAKDKEDYRRDPEKHKAAAKWGAVKSKFGLTREMWMQKFNEQGGQCPICSRALSERPLTLRDKRGACVDHCHKTGRIRGLLCNRCNQGIGLLGDDPQRVAKAASYLKGHADVGPVHS